MTEIAANKPKPAHGILVFLLLCAVLVAVFGYALGLVDGWSSHREFQDCLKRSSERYGQCLDTAQCACLCDEFSPTEECP